MKITKKDNVVVAGIKYVAVISNPLQKNCPKCAFNEDGDKNCLKAPCTPSSRKDVKDVYFIKKVENETV